MGDVLLHVGTEQAAEGRVAERSDPAGDARRSCNRSSTGGRSCACPNIPLINLPTNYLGVAFSIARLRMLLGWEDASGGQQLLEKILDHYQRYSGEYGFSDETDGAGPLRSLQRAADRRDRRAADRDRDGRDAASEDVAPEIGRPRARESERARRRIQLRPQHRPVRRHGISRGAVGGGLFRRADAGGEGHGVCVRHARRPEVRRFLGRFRHALGEHVGEGARDRPIPEQDAHPRREFQPVGSARQDQRRVEPARLQESRAVCGVRGVAREAAARRRSRGLRAGSTIARC